MLQGMLLALIWHDMIRFLYYARYRSLLPDTVVVASL